MVKLLITGSRNATPKMQNYAGSVVKRAKTLGWEIIVGDASGIDTCVVGECLLWGVPFTMYGAYNKLRITGIQSTIKVVGDYLERDRVMAQDCDKCIAIWNGSSRGTKYTYDYAVKLGKESWLKTFS